MRVCCSDHWLYSPEGQGDVSAAHDGRRRCQEEGCPKAAAIGGTQFCRTHADGGRCEEKGCTKHDLDGTVHRIKATKIPDPKPDPVTPAWSVSSYPSRHLCSIAAEPQQRPVLVRIWVPASVGANHDGMSLGTELPREPAPTEDDGAISPRSPASTRFKSPRERQK